jgi:hypothetical protein
VSDILSNGEKEMIAAIRARYFRVVIASPEGAIVHHGDCKFYDHSHVCTCGLLHDLNYLTADTATAIYSPFWKEWMTHDRGLRT